MSATISQILEAIGDDATCVGPLTRTDRKVTDVAALHSRVVEHRLTLSWWDGSAVFPHGWETEGVILVKRDAMTPRHAGALIRCADPRLALARVLARYFSAYVPVRWRDFYMPAEFHHTPVKLWAANLSIAPTAVVGASGQAFAWDPETERHIAIPHLYGVVFGDDVVVGPHSTIQRGVLSDTVIGHDVKIGQSVNVGHGAYVEDHCILTAHACIGGSAVLHERVFVGMGAIVKNGVRVGAGATIGAGAVVVRDVAPRTVVAGVPARLIDGPTPSATA